MNNTGTKFPLLTYMVRKVLHRDGKKAEYTVDEFKNGEFYQTLYPMVVFSTEKRARRIVSIMNRMTHEQNQHILDIETYVA